MLTCMLAFALYVQAESRSELRSISEEDLSKKVEYYSTATPKLSEVQIEAMRTKAKMYEAILSYGDENDKLRHLLFETMKSQKSILNALETNNNNQALQIQSKLVTTRMDELKSYLGL